MWKICGEAYSEAVKIMECDGIDVTYQVDDNL